MYGTALPQVMNLARSNKSLAIPLNTDGEMSAQVVYAIREELACTLMDILIRRTGIGTLGHPGEKALETIAEIAAKKLNWNRKRIALELEKASKSIRLP